jgi:hypothetical protein
MGGCGLLQEAVLRNTSSATASSDGQLFRRKRRPTMMRLVAFPKAVLVFALLMASQEGRLARAYYYDYPTTLFNRAQNCHQYYGGRKEDVLARKFPARRSGFSRLASSDFSQGDEADDPERSEGTSDLERKLVRRITRLEALVSKQEIEIHRLKKSNEELVATTEAFAQVIQLLKEAGLGSAENSNEDNGNKTQESGDLQSTAKEQTSRIVESFDDSMIFGTAPSSVNDAADAAGAAILAAMLGGKQRMLVDVRDAELSSDPETLVQFIELAILPVAAGLEGLKSTRNRVKIVFPKVSQLLEYRRTMALAAPEVVALSTLGFDPVERKDKLVVIVAPEPDDEEGLEAMRDLLYPSDSSKSIQQPIVILNYHMVPVAQLKVDFETAYHLRLLSVQFMSGGMANEIASKFKAEKNDVAEMQEEKLVENEVTNEDEAEASSNTDVDENEDDQALEAAMKHAHQLGMNQGVTRAMVIRAYPR